jgi:hypothetical protein
LDVADRRLIHGRLRFPGAVRRVAVLQHGDDPVIEPGELLVRVIIEAPEDRGGQQQALAAFDQAHFPATGQFRRYAAAVMSQIPRRNGWTIAAHAGDRTPDKTQRLLSRAVWDAFAAIGVVRRFSVAGGPAAAACPDCEAVLARRQDTVLARPRDVRRAGDPVAVWWVKPRCTGGRTAWLARGEETD